nr:hypothetical protein GCM10025730_48220 [Promicromonospora thailandica]
MGPAHRLGVDPVPRQPRAHQLAHAHPGGTVSLSGFAQGVAYALGALGPLLVGLLHDVTGGWTSPLLFLVAVALVATVPAITLARPAFVEDELDR